MTPAAKTERPARPAKPVAKWVAEGRAVVVCADGPLASRWYFVDDWKASVAAAQHLVDVGGQAGSVYLEYVATGRTMPHPKEPVVGQVLRWRRPGLAALSTSSRRRGGVR